MSDWHEEARAMKAADPTLTNAEIGRRLGVTTSSAWKALNPDRARELAREDNKKRRAYKQAWQNQADRTERHRGRCTDCGGLRGAGSARKPEGLCVGCFRKARRERCVVIAALYLDGRLLKEIAAALGLTVNHLGSELSQMRNDGWDLPHRYGPERVANMAAGRRRKGAEQVAA